MPVDDTLHGGQPYTGSFEGVPVVKPLKHPKQLVGVFHVEPDSVVSNDHDRLVVFSFGASDLDLSLRPCACELDGVGNEVDERKCQHRTVPRHVGQRGDRPGDMAPLRLGP